MTTNKETFPFSTKKHCSLLFYWHSTDSHMTTDSYRKCVISATIWSLLSAYLELSAYHSAWAASCWPINSQLWVSSDAHRGMLWSGQHEALRDSTSFSPDHWTVAPAIHLEPQVFPTTGSSQIHLACSRQAQTVNTPHLLSVYSLAQGRQQISAARFHMNYTTGTRKLSSEDPPIYLFFSQFQKCHLKCTGIC